MNEEIQALLKTISELTARIDTLEKRLNAREFVVEKILVRDSFRIGSGTTTIKMSKEGLWAGQLRYNDIAVNAMTGTAIGIDGTFTNNP